jgi:CRP-like cAMP-binding protein
MKQVLAGCRLFEGLEDRHLSRIVALAGRAALQPGEHLFLLGDSADRMFVVLEGQIDLCLPLTIRGAVEEVVVQSERPGGALGWSAFVKPYRFRLSARAAGSAVVAGFDRTAVLKLADSDPAFGRLLFERIAEVIGQRLLTVEALWARALQRSVASASDMPQTRPD